MDTFGRELKSGDQDLLYDYADGQKMLPELDDQDCAVATLKVFGRAGSILPTSSKPSFERRD